MALFNNDPIDNPDDFQIDDKDYETELVGEGKKFKTTKDLAKAKAQSDAFIEQLKNENKVAREAAARLQEELKTQKTLKEFMDQIAPSNNRNSQPPAKEPNNEGENEVTTESIKQLVEQTIASRSAEQQGQVNLDNVKKQLIQTYGNQYENILRQRTKDLGMSEQEMTNMAMKQPKAFLALVSPSIEKTTDIFNTPRSSLNTEALRLNGGQVKNWSYYEKIRKTDQRKYFEPSMHNEMMKQLEQLGPDEFYK